MSSVLSLSGSYIWPAVLIQVISKKHCHTRDVQCKAYAVFCLSTDTWDRCFERLYTRVRNLAQTVLTNFYKEGPESRQTAESKPSGLKPFAHG